MDAEQQAIVDFVVRKNLSSNSHIKNAVRDFKQSHPDLTSLSKADIERRLRIAIHDKNQTHSGPNIFVPDRQKKSRSHPEEDGAKSITISAPYRFTTLENAVAMPEPEGPIDRSMPLADGLCASIEVEWVAETPLLIGDGGADVAAPMHYPHPQKADQDRYVIPGSTLRGMIRSTTEALALGRLSQFNGHHRYGFRDFNHPKYSSCYQVGDKRALKAGWLRCSGDPSHPDTQWTIQPTKEKPALIWIDDMRDMFTSGAASRVEWVNKDINEKYSQLGLVSSDEENPEKKIYRFQNQEFFFSNPYHKTITDEDGKDKNRLVCDNNGRRAGYFVFSGALEEKEKKEEERKKAGKKHEYVFYHDAEGADWVPIDASIVQEFHRLNSKPSANAPKPEGTYGEFYHTLSMGLPVPVFYVGDLSQIEGDFWFGFTRLFKVPHTSTVRQVLEEGYPAHKISWGSALSLAHYQPDFVEALFGYVKEPHEVGLPDDGRTAAVQVARRGRVSFSTAWIKPNQAPIASDSIPTVSMAPRPSFAPFYLGACNRGGELDYSPTKKGSVTLAGRKRYLPRFSDEGNPQERLQSIKSFYDDHILRLEEEQGGPVSPEICSNVRFLHAAERPLSFTSTIKLHNVTPAELGAVLFALTLGGDPAKPYRHMIGRGKPAGAGQMRVQTARLQVRPNRRSVVPLGANGDEVLSHDGLRGYCPPPGAEQVSHSHLPYLKAFQRHMQKTVGAEAYPQIPSVIEFLNSCDPAVGASIDPQRMSYMPLDSYTALRRAYSAHKKENPPPIKLIAPLEANEVRRLLPVPKGRIKTALKSSS